MKGVALEQEPELLKQLTQGSSEAFTKIYNAYSQRIYANILHLVKDPDLAQEFLQDVFMRLWENRATIDSNLSFQSYLFRTSSNLVYDYMRREKVKTQVQNYLIHVGTELHTDQEDELAYKQSKVILDTTISKLPPMRRQVYQLCKIEGISYKEVSEQLNISTSTINDHIVKATKFIKEEFMSADNSGAVIATIILWRCLYVIWIALLFNY
ncbi:MAG: RNA polymerase sigma-70 factor [Candidatus Pedobacter colombiensis]|uniref:RNA polymerase sigma-70 factor n=1 Tax=Candidatus Pedobacter colombiensis TaxID=3121371 RepID=A0AAJ6B7B9_9SPHI|nr:RNA polymerase sigma-70 factor [Pedobacter sp.]WEK17913.1 MAG: RNA polymerase sigma-70 factor [Pedobacter sp.]